jgi:integrase
MTGDSVKKGSGLLTKKPENWEFIKDKTIERLKKQAKATPTNRIIWDEGSGTYKNKVVDRVRGFGVRLTEAGTITYVLNYHIDGKERRYTIGKLGEYTPITAREEAGKLLGKITNTKGYDPLEERKESKEEPTFSELVTAWLEFAKTVKKKRESSLYDDRRMLGLNDDGTPIVDANPAMKKRRILTELGERRLSKITQREIARFHTSIKDTPVRPGKEESPYRANRALVLIKTIFNFGMRDPKFRDFIEENPAQGIDLFTETAHEKCLNKETGEITKFLQALDSYGNETAESESGEKRNAEKRNAANCLRLMLLTGCRVSEALTAEWRDFDLTSGVWTKLSHKTKQNQTEHVQLGDDAVDLLCSMKPKNATGPLFPGRGGKGMRESLKRPWLQICKAIGRVEEKTVQGKRGPLTHYKPTMRLHDLRHTFASVLVSNGESLFAVGKQLGHVQASTTQRYSHFAPEAGRAAANKFAKIIEFKKRSA